MRSIPVPAKRGDCSVSRQRARWIVAALMPLAILAIPYAPRAAAADSGDSGTQQSGTQDLQPPGTLAQLNDIIVTAQRKEERLQDVGISITALSADELQQMDMNSATDLVRSVPSLKLNAFSSAAVVWNIRGVSQNDYGDQQEPPVAVYQDDSYSSSINTSSFPIFDLARVETLRGPQGTLFGRNATGGAIQFISNKPTKEFEGYATATYGSFNERIFEGGSLRTITRQSAVPARGDQGQRQRLHHRCHPWTGRLWRRKPLCAPRHARLATP